ncbi:MAG: hypothetical protein H8E21_08355 [Gammaproteobacteria bacterium]|nr:hypothetical protein [Gammaproteobacteria bacterium]MBL6998750.1 hypothetical protein [Gammaproteobacteria bacterium]
MGAGLMGIHGLPRLQSIVLLLLALVVAPLLAAAEPDSKEKEADLLKSWGFNTSPQGQLKFDDDAEALDEYQPWSPEISDFQIPEVVKAPPHVLQPLVISSKQKHAD